MSRAKTQSTLFDAPRPGSNLPEFGVGEISRLLKKTVEETFGLVRVRGEISGFKIAPSGHVYFNLKDEEAVLASVCWKGQHAKLGIKPEDGMEVICTGRLTTYPARSNYQLTVEGMALAGMGALLKLLEERKKKLAVEGLFGAERKRALPFLPEVIGVVTSPTGAVIRDILHRLEDRFPRHVLVWPVLVQGEGAAEQIATAIRGFNDLPEGGKIPRPDLLIVARGGGSIEDLMPFNEENVVRAVAASRIPVISAVGHEADTTLIDFAADIRAPTPTAAAEMAVPVRDDLLEQVAEEGIRLVQAMRRMIEDRRERLSLTERALGDPARVLEPLSQRLDEKAERLMLAWQAYFERRAGRVAEAAGRLRHPRDLLQLATQKLAHLGQRQEAALRENLTRWQNRMDTLGTALGHLSPRAVLGRGYALVQNAQGQVVISSRQLRGGDAISIEFNDGKTGAVVNRD
ncbi:MAG: exodeoxyribonuclease VII large subunit [Alphaproteobacteria bacterium]|nr:exodeoxyribonuclease VII large subunit [Alphaproteobacteria bacterium]